MAMEARVAEFPANVSTDVRKGPANPLLSGIMRFGVRPIAEGTVGALATRQIASAVAERLSLTSQLLVWIVIAYGLGVIMAEATRATARNMIRRRQRATAIADDESPAQLPSGSLAKLFLGGTVIVSLAAAVGYLRAENSRLAASASGISQSLSYTEFALFSLLSLATALGLLLWASESDNPARDYASTEHAALRAAQARLEVARTDESNARGRAEGYAHRELGRVRSAARAAEGRKLILPTRAGTTAGDQLALNGAEPETHN
jgi:hypothetical protein